MKRRNFLQLAATTAAGIGLGNNLPVASAAPAAKNGLRITSHCQGAVVNRRQGVPVEGGLRITIRGEAPAGESVKVNGVAAKREGSQFSADVVLRSKLTDVVASTEGASGRNETRTRIVWDRNSFPRYRFTIDDNGFFIRDIVQKNYKSLFDCFYLSLLRDLHKKYKAKFTLNMFHALADGFTLKQMPDRYRGEWKGNADWLKLAFHADKEDPPRPYYDATPAKLGADYDMVTEQLIRFAGEEAYSPASVIHFGEVRPDAYKTLGARGVRSLSGYFTKNNGGWYVHYRMDDERSAYLSEHEALVDFDSGITFSRIDIVCNCVTAENTVPTLKKVADNPNTGEVLDLLTHEQYFWPYYSNYIPDHGKRLDLAIRFATERGYKPVFFHEGLLGAPDAA